MSLGPAPAPDEAAPVARPPGRGGEGRNSVTELPWIRSSLAALVCGVAATLLASAAPARGEEPALVRPGLVRMDASGSCWVAASRVIALDRSPLPDTQLVTCRTLFVPDAAGDAGPGPIATPWVRGVVVEAEDGASPPATSWYDAESGQPAQERRLQLDPTRAYAVSTEVRWHPLHRTEEVLGRTQLDLGVLPAGGGLVGLSLAATAADERPLEELLPRRPWWRRLPGYVYVLVLGGLAWLVWRLS